MVEDLRHDFCTLDERRRAEAVAGTRFWLVVLAYQFLVTVCVFITAGPITKLFA